MITLPYQAVVPVLILSAGFGLSTPLFAEALGSDQVIENATLAAGESAVFDIEAKPQSYIRGRLHSHVQPMDLTITDEAGRPVRLLLDDALGARQFHFVLDPGQSLVARNEGDAEAAIALEFERSIAPEEMTGLQAPYLSPTLGNWAKKIAAGDSTDAFWQDRARHGTPMIEPSPRDGYVIATFLWRGAARNVRLWGGPTYDHTWMSRLGDSDIWYASFEMSTKARLSYGFAPDVPQFDGSARENRVALLATLQADPLNKTPIYTDAPDRFSQRSIVEGPDAPVQPGMIGEAPAGQVVSAVLTSDDAPDRRVEYYTPAGFDPKDPDTVLLVMFDGPSYQTDRAPLPRILDQLIAEAQLPQVAVAFIDPVDGDQRGVDLTCNPEFADRLATQWLPQMETALGIAPDAKHRALSGSSYGGLATAYITHRHPEVFGNGIVLSGSFWWGPDGYEAQGLPYMSRLWMERAPKVRLWMSAGLYEVGRTPGTVSILETTRHLRDILNLQGVDARYREYAGGHDYLVWRGALAEGLLHLFGR